MQCQLWNSHSAFSKILLLLLPPSSFFHVSASLWNETPWIIVDLDFFSTIFSWTHSTEASSFPPHTHLRKVVLIKIIGALHNAYLCGPFVVFELVDLSVIFDTAHLWNCFFISEIGNILLSGFVYLFLCLLSRPDILWCSLFPRKILPLDLIQSYHFKYYLYTSISRIFISRTDISPELQTCMCRFLKFSKDI